jgi:Arc/MetJ family transcription regulator
MRSPLSIDDSLLDEAREIAGLPSDAPAEVVIRRLIANERQRRALKELQGIGWDGPRYSRPTFESLAEEFRTLTEGRVHTPSEQLMREGRFER